jgi:hypothetical protein
MAETFHWAGFVQEWILEACGAHGLASHFQQPSLGHEWEFHLVARSLENGSELWIDSEGHLAGIECAVSPGSD